MAHNRDYKPEDIAFPNQIIKESELVSHRLIEPADTALFERLKQFFKIQLVLGDDDQAAGVDIQPVADIGHA